MPAVDEPIPAVRDKLVNNGVLKPGFGVLFHGASFRGGAFS
jgi:hypothetical protein